MLDLLREHELFASIKKCAFMQRWTLFLGHLIGANGIKAEPAKSSVVQEWPMLTDLGLLGPLQLFPQIHPGLCQAGRPPVKADQERCAFLLDP